MKKWPILGAIVCALGLCGVLIVLWVTADRPPAAQSSEPPVLQTVLHTPTEATAAPTTVPETVIPEPTYPVYEDPDESQLTCRHAFVYDLTYDRLLYTYGDQTESISPASLTKLMTCYVALQYLDPDTVIQVGEEAGWIAPDSSIAAIQPGNMLTVEMITQGTLMQSGNDGAYVLAVAAGRVIAKDPALDGRTALATFMAEVNAQLRQLGLKNTHFVTPDGYDAEGHYTTASDLLQIARIAVTQPMIVRFAAMEKDVVTYESGENYTWVNTNWLLRQTDFPDLYCPEAMGLKTGGTRKAGNCIIATFDTGDRILMIGVLGCEIIQQRFTDARFLFEHFRTPGKTQTETMPTE